MSEIQITPTADKEVSDVTITESVSPTARPDTAEIFVRKQKTISDRIADIIGMAGYGVLSLSERISGLPSDIKAGTRKLGEIAVRTKHLPNVLVNTVTVLGDHDLSVNPSCPPSLENYLERIQHNLGDEHR